MSVWQSYGNPLGGTTKKVDAYKHIAGNQSSVSPLIFAVPHSGRYYPEDFMSKVTLSELEIRESEDAFVDQLVSFAPELGADLLIANYPRAYLDLNRFRNELDPSMFTPPLNERSVRLSRRVRVGLGVVPRIVADKKPIYDCLLQAEEAEARLAHIWDPYHQKLQALIDAKIKSCGRAVLIDCHSMPDLNTGRGWFDNQPKVVIGDNWGRACQPMVIGQLESLFRQSGLSVRRNVPYAGGYAICHYGSADKNIDAVQMELARGLYMRSSDMSKTKQFDMLRAKLESIFTIFNNYLPLLSNDHLAAE